MLNNTILDYKPPRNDNVRANRKRQIKAGKIVIIVTFGMIFVLLTFNSCFRTYKGNCQECHAPEVVKYHNEKEYVAGMKAEAKYRANKMLKDKINY
jgi:hypothetical protein